jgi:hypothetical protein
MGRMSGLPASFRVTYAQYGELREDIAQQMARGGLLVKVHDTPGLDFDSSVALELVLPDGTSVQGIGKVLQIFAGFGVAVTVESQLVEQVSRLASRPEVGTGTARHERIEPPSRPARRRPASTQPLPALPRPLERSRPGITPPPFTTSPSSSRDFPPSPLTAAPPRSRDVTPSPLAALTPSRDITPLPFAAAPARSEPHIPLPPFAAPPAGSPPTGSPPAGSTSAGSPPGAPIKPVPTRMEKVQMALHGTRDERNTILRDRDRTLHAFVLKNPQLDADDVVAIAKNAQMTSEMLKQVAERKEWIQRPAVALALARNPRTPPELAVRALDHLPIEALRQMAKGSGVLPHVCQAARKKLLG